MFWYVALGIIVVIAVLLVGLRRRSAGRTSIDQRDLRSARWTNEGRGGYNGGF